MHELISLIISAVLCVGPTAPPQHPANESTINIALFGAEHPSPMPLRAVVLTCDPAGGTHPDPVTACAKLAAVDGDLDRLTPLNLACPLIFAPVTVRAVGDWQGAPVEFEETYENDCVARDRSGGVFQF
ncbi:MAG TPA: SSI family serine proteinase inhibitor [Actinophytocola sp.]|uniref:SSI family serine proteinase inhibitor n=1 Tax=Actinophytocola sp. TaxID=1872138 RepID=UPI002DB9BA3E|nr:SSI family serine proteinase inhibitor [Actinophytocola sp.]HEU5474795.1 SSI family serine proteinase inhibitor [Actinophytocola sp.]